MTDDPIAQIRARLERVLNVYPLPWAEVAESGDWWMECGPRDAEGKGAYFITDGLDGTVSTWLENAPGDVAHLLAEHERLRGIIRMARERLYDAHGRDAHHTYEVIRAVGNILRRGENPDA